jgi:excisionase family DNA binding protein
MNNTRENKALRIDNPVAKRLYTLKEASHYLGRPVFSLRTLIWNGKLPYVQDGRKYYLDVQDLDAYIESQKTRILQ